MRMIGQSAAKILKPLLQAMDKVQRLDDYRLYMKG